MMISMVNSAIQFLQIAEPIIGPITVLVMNIGALALDNFSCVQPPYDPGSQRFSSFVATSETPLYG